MEKGKGFEMILTLLRETLSPATMGRLFIDGIAQADTLERPWMDNKRGVSCIPPGTYGITMTVSPRFGRPMIRLMGTDPRWGILIHAANEVQQLQGCIALGKRHGPHTLIESRKAVNMLEEKVREALRHGEAVQILIENPKVTA